MATRYRYAWVNEVNGWNHRLDILPYDATLSDSITTGLSGVVLEVGALELGFDELPIGLMNAPTMTVKMNFTKMPTALQTYLMNKTNGNDRNVFLFWTDRGTNGGSYSLEFCGTQANEESADYDYINNSDLATTDLVVEYELIDCLHHAMSNSGGSSIFDGSLYAASNGTKRTYYYEYLAPITKNSYFDVTESGAALNFYYNMSSWSHCMARLRTSLSNVLNGDYARTTNATEISDADGADATLELDTLITTGVIFYERDQSGDGLAKSELDEDTAYLVTHVYAPDGTLTGGLWDNNDEYGWYQASAVIDLVRDWCESFGVRASYRPTYVADAGGDFIRYTWNIAAVGDYSDAFTSAASVDLTKALEIGTISEGATTISKAEVRYDLNSARYNADLTEYVAINNRSRSTRSWNTEPIVHNVPSYKPTVKSSQGLIEAGLYQTNRITSIVNGYAHKAHEQCKIWLSQNLNIDYDTTFTDTKPASWSDADDGDKIADYPKTDNAVYTAWLNAAQRQSSPAGVAEAMLTAFGSEFQTTVEATYPLSYSANVRPSVFGTKHSLSNGPASQLTHLPWTNAMIVGMSVDFTAGTNTISYVLLDL